MIRIIGVGSPLGDDAAGLEAARQLAAAPPRGCEVVAADRPGLGLIELLDGADAVIVIDAVCSGAAPGAMHDVGLRQLARGVPAPASSHAFGVAAALQLAAQLGRAPASGRVIGVEIAPAAGPGGLTAPASRLTAPARAGVARAIQRARRWARRFSQAERAPDGPGAPVSEVRHCNREVEETTVRTACLTD